MAPGLLAKILPRAPGIVQQGASVAAKVLGNPWVNGGIGAEEGYRHGGVRGALAGAVTGYGISRGLGALSGGSSVDVAGGMSQAGRAAAESVSDRTGVRVPMLDALMRGASADELAAMVTPKAAAAPVAQTGQAALASQLAAREALARPINWRTTDVTPIKRPGANIILGEESTPGLLEMLQDALLAKDAPLAEKLQKAIRQRSHITGKVGEP